MFFIFAWINGWVNNREAGDLRRRCAHYDVTKMGAANGLGQLWPGNSHLFGGTKQIVERNET